MEVFSFLTYKPVLIGLHLGFAIIGIDAFLWLLGELFGESRRLARMKTASLIGLIGFVLAWLVGGYYYVVYYGKLVKPVILKGTTPWAHAIAMEAKEHIFLFLIPMAITIMLAVFLLRDEAEWEPVKKNLKILVGLTAGLGLFIGALGFIISAAARWG